MPSSRINFRKKRRWLLPEVKKIKYFYENLWKYNMLLKKIIEIISISHNVFCTKCISSFIHKMWSIFISYSTCVCSRAIEIMVSLRTVIFRLEVCWKQLGSLLKNTNFLKTKVKVPWPLVYSKPLTLSVGGVFCVVSVLLESYSAKLIGKKLMDYGQLIFKKFTVSQTGDSDMQTS